MAEQADVKTDQVGNDQDVNYSEEFKKMQEAQALMSERLEQMKKELSTRDSTISRLAEEKKQAEKAKLTETEQIKLELQEVKMEREADRLRAVMAENKADVLKQFEENKVPSKLIEFMPLDKSDLIADKAELLKTIVDSIRQEEAERYAKGHGDKVKTSVNLDGVDAGNITADELTRLWKSDPDKAKAILAAKKNRS